MIKCNVCGLIVLLLTACSGTDTFYNNINHCQGHDCDCRTHRDVGGSFMFHKPTKQGKRRIMQGEPPEFESDNPAISVGFCHGD
ncbi:hypothetical protein BL250_08475 [Erwinia sp. OLTSP20]|nr:hypothetical protein BV501_04565 [Erwinia sp. OAMSP11]PIJ74095.1 hypothetical protein BK416_04855 [Erwinia sp. OLSSP12]PIJ81201.1 hypothetical protein BLD47_09700 [Erwinia sp. OLCASP19]PIJ86058.1 hypothetical protein BLD46_04650 [Erwinia sp. OLMTSP26]PIJ87807.1 hypothetical protein BLD49_04650 [Erwinia sp. OLMDSP33]PIJ90839.1 hypothetical protein BL249_11070 [Erwinia sp. OLFS4]PIJ92725.1 hypothetical protein BL250_08475 [Erwinia sp. OLTSP20]